MYRHVCIISKDICINKEKEICLPNKECIIDHSCKRTNMVAKCKIVINCSKNFIGSCKKYGCLQGIIKGLWI